MADVLDRFGRVSLAFTPTPLEHLANFTKALGGPDIWIKRDDCTGFALGGNKVRKLEFLMAEAQSKGATAIVTAGGTQSNHVRQTAAAASRLGMECHAVLERVRTDALYETNGNLLLDHMFGAVPHFVEKDADMDAAMDALVGDLTAKGETVYAVPVGGSNSLGALGYVSCAFELAGQLREAGVHPGLIVHASGSAGTQAGLLVGLALAGLEIAVVGMCVSRAAGAQQEKVSALVAATCDLIGRPDLADVIEVNCDGAYVGPGYGVETPEMADAVRMLARTEGIFLDPVYTGKAMAGLIDYARTGKLAGTGPVLFLHTGGTPALFVYPEIADG
ncbi:MAG: D-cysteine desulfhydrase [Rhodospirillales bacterium]|nr:D-cysteine desulfhydrase [Rhodospirillales bacterium]MBO6788157.1 D-cysteine desulfhydrase [Rhodospirillales bacterium]